MLRQITALRDFASAYDRLGSNATERSKPHNRACPLCPEKDKRTDVWLSPLCANRDLMRRSKKAPLFGHLVGIRGTGFMERRHASLVRLDVCELDYLGPLLHVF